jgi:hypothetical protein
MWLSLYFPTTERPAATTKKMEPRMTRMSTDKKDMESVGIVTILETLEAILKGIVIRENL